MNVQVAIALGLVAGLVFGLLAALTGSQPLLALAEGIAPLGTAFVNLFRMVVIPLVATTWVLVTTVVTPLSTRSLVLELKSIPSI